MKHTPDLQTVISRPVKDEIVAEALHPLGSKSCMVELRPRTTNHGIFRQELEGVVSRLQKAAGHFFIVLTQITIDGLQIAEHLFALIVSQGHQAAAMMRWMLERSPGRKRPAAASSSRV
jgi:hypothetical protein